MAEEALMEQKTAEKADMLDDLLAFIDNQEVEELEISTEDTFSIHDRRQADYLTGQYLKLQNEIDEIDKTCAETLKSYTDKINAWREAEIRRRESSMNWLAARLRAYAEQQLEGSKRKSLSLPNGSLKFSKKSVTHYDEDTLRTFLERTEPKFLKAQQPKIDKAGLKKACQEQEGHMYLNGMEVEGIEVEHMPDTFKIV